jgi:hypothetical protein
MFTVTRGKAPHLERRGKNINKGKGTHGLSLWKSLTDLLDPRLKITKENIGLEKWYCANFKVLYSFVSIQMSINGNWKKCFFEIKES